MRSYDIAFLLGYPEISGGTNVIMEHALGLSRLGHRVSIVTEVPFDPQRLFWKPEAVKLPLLSHADSVNRRFDISIATWWRSVFDLPHVPAKWYAYFCQSIESRFFHEEDSDSKALVDYTYRQPLAIVTEASWIARYLEENYHRQAAVVRNGIDKSLFKPDGEVVESRPRGGMRVLVEGPLGVGFKRVELTIRLCQQAGLKDIWLLTPSSCNGYAGVRRVFSQIPMAQVGAVYRSCDVLVKLSTVEGMFGPPLEMMHCGGTAITSDVTGHEEYMRHGENGIVVRGVNEMEVVKYLRSLQRRREFLEKLKQGAGETARAWPAWPDAVKAMERFIISVVERDPTHEIAQDYAMQSLRAALMLSGPLNWAAKREYPARLLVRMLRRKFARHVRRRVPILDRIVPAPVCPQEAVDHPARQIPELPDSRALVPRPTYRVCFVGDERIHRAHTPSRAERMLCHFVDAAAGIGPEQLAAIHNFAPDLTFVFEPDRLTADLIAELPGIVVAHTCRDLSPADIQRCRVLFPAAKGARAALLHVDARVAARLVEARIHAPGSFLLPTDGRVFARDDAFEQWLGRDIHVLYVGQTTPANRPYLSVLAEHPGFLQISQPTADRTLRSVLAGTKMVVHLPGASNDHIDTAKVIRDMMSGCLVLGGRFSVDYGLMPGEHYLFVDRPDELAWQVARQLDMPDDLDVIRRVGMRQAYRFDAERCYVPMIEKYFCQSPDSTVGAE